MMVYAPMRIDPTRIKGRGAHPVPTCGRVRAHCLAFDAGVGVVGVRRSWSVWWRRVVVRPAMSIPQSSK